MLPHYSLREGKLYFLDQNVVPLSPNEIGALQNLGRGGDAATVQRLVQLGVLSATHRFPEGSARYLIVAPHSDDAALSVGGTMLADGGREPYILNVFSTCAFTVLPRYLRSAKEITELNNREEEAMAAAVGGRVEFLSYPEALLRGYDSWRGEPDPRKDGEIPLRTELRIRQVLAGLQDADVFFPLGVGSHIDHVVVSNIGMRLVEEGAVPPDRCYFYEDLPYACEDRAAVGKRVRLLGGAEEVLCDVTEQMEGKIGLVAIYKSQYGRSDLLCLASHAATLQGDGRCYERSWRKAR